MTLSKRKALMNAFFDSQFKYCPDSQFKYCPFIWMCCSRTNNSKIDRLHERCSRIISNDKHSSFKELLEKDSPVFVHEKNIQILATKMYNVSNNFSRQRQNSQFSQPLVKAVYHGTESLSFLGPKVWDILPNIYENIDGL